MSVKTPLIKARGIAAKFRGLNTSRPDKIWQFHNKVNEKVPVSGDLFIYEPIGVDWWTGEGITGKSVNDALAEMKGIKTLNIYINCEGGDVFEAKAIYSSLKRFEAQKIIYIDGIAASAATFIAMAGDVIKTSSVATWMIHEAWTMAVGPADDLRSVADLLDLENQIIAETYANQTGGTIEEMLSMMADETWMDAKTALERGFTDEIVAVVDETQVAANIAHGPAIALAEATQERIKGMSAGRLMSARVDMRKRDYPGLPGQKR